MDRAFQRSRSLMLCGTFYSVPPTYGDEKHNISENWLEENNFRNLLDERGRELYWEGIRRTDLVRFDLLTSGSYTWDFKGGINTGVGVNKRYNVYPIPVTDLTVNGNLQQNEGY